MGRALLLSAPPAGTERQKRRKPVAVSISDRCTPPYGLTHGSLDLHIVETDLSALPGQAIEDLRPITEPRPVTVEIPGPVAVKSSTCSSASP